MGRGRKRVSPEQKRLRGDTRNEGAAQLRERLDSAPQPQGTVVAPTWLTPTARRLWDRIAPEYERIKVLRFGNEETFGLYCQVAADIARVQRRINRDGYVAKKTTRGHPLLSHLSQLRQQLVSLASEFGLTAASRSKIVGASQAGRVAPGEQPQTPQAIGDRLRARSRMTAINGGLTTAPPPESAS